MSKLNRIKQLGFSLIELMVVVAIIGILATVAVPNVRKFMAKSRQSEAKTNLASIYTSEKAFFVEHQGYYTNLVSIGYRPEGLLKYVHGFQNGAITPTSYTVVSGAVAGTLPGDNMDTLVLCPAAGVTCQTDANTAAANISNALATSTLTSFLAFSEGDIASSGVLDTWTINENKTLINLIDGIQ